MNGEFCCLKIVNVTTGKQELKFVIPGICNYLIIIYVTTSVSYRGEALRFLPASVAQKLKHCDVMSALTQSITAVRRQVYTVAK